MLLMTESLEFSEFNSNDYTVVVLLMAMVATMA